MTTKEPGKSLATLFPFILLHQTIGALGFPITKVGVTEMDPYVFAFFRFVIATILLLGYVWWTERGNSQSRAIERSDWPRIALLAFLMVGLNQLGYVVGQKLTGAGHGSLLYATTPIYVFIFSAFMLKEGMPWRRALGIVIAVIGVILIVGQGAQLSAAYLLGDSIIFVAVLGWALYTVLGKPLVAKYGAFRMTAYPLAIGTLCYAPLGIYRSVIFDYSAVTLRGWSAMLFMAIAMSVIAYVAWYWVLKHMDAGRLALFSNIQPLIAVLASWLMIGEAPTVVFAIGAGVVLAGLLIAEWPGKASGV